MTLAEMIIARAKKGMNTASVPEEAAKYGIISRTKVDGFTTYILADKSVLITTGRGRGHNMWAEKGDSE